jgi:hypothetical protein
MRSACSSNRCQPQSKMPASGPGKAHDKQVQLQMLQVSQANCTEQSDVLYGNLHVCVVRLVPCVELCELLSKLHQATSI